MKFLRLDLLAFGPFTNTVLDLSPGNQGLHLLYGPNEAGKSSALRAVRQLFVGIDHQSNDNFIHKNDKLRIGAALQNARGAVFEFRRRKGRLKTLLDRDEVALDDARIDAFLEGIKIDDFVRKFTINHSELVAGGQAVISGGGEIGQLLFMAGASLVGLATVQKRLEDECDDLFKRNASKPKINATCAELEQVRKSQRDSVLRGSDWLEHVEALQHARDTKTRVQEALEKAELGLRRLTRLQQALEPIAKRKQVLHELSPLADAVVLPPEFALDHREAVSKLEPTKIAEEKLLKDLKAIDQELKALDVPEVLLERAESIEQLHVRLGSYQQSMRERTTLLAECGQLEADVATIRRDLARGSEKEDASSIRPLTVDERALIQELGSIREVVFKTETDAQSALSRHAARHVVISKNLQAIGPPPDSLRLQRAIVQAQRLGSIEEDIATDRALLNRDLAQAGVDLAALGLWSGTLDELERLPCPSAETMEEARGQLEQDARIVDDLKARIVQLETQSHEIDANIEKLRREGEVPTEHDLQLARMERSNAWHQLKQDWNAGPNTAATARYEQEVLAADEIADRLRREAKRVADNSSFHADRMRCTKSLDDLRRNLGLAERQLIAAHDGWRDTWRALGITPLAPREMLAWVRKQMALAGLARAIRERQASLAQREAKIALATTELRAAVSELEAAEEPAGLSLTELIERGEVLVNSLVKRATERARLETDLSTLEAERQSLEETARCARVERDHWQTRWEAAMGLLGLATDAGPAEASAVVTRLTELFGRLDTICSYRLRIEAIDHDEARFNQEVYALAAHIAQDLTNAPAEHVAAELNRRLTRARELHNRRTALHERREQTEKAASEARNTVLTMRARLASLCRLAGCDHEHQLPAIEERSRQRQSLQSELDDLNRRLALLSGEAFDNFIQEAESKDADVLALEISRLNEEIGRLKQEQEAHDQTIGREDQIINDMKVSVGATDANQDAENLKARIRADVEQYTRLRLASAVLRQGIERYRQKSQGPILNRASELFGVLTLGSFERLTVDYNDKDEPVLKGVRPGGERVGVEGMSLGTADQLYLATKLATLEAYLEKGEPVPFIVDDILIQFDDERATAALRILAALSRRTQVLLFTHHRRLVDLAELHLDASIRFTHVLSGRS